MVIVAAVVLTVISRATVRRIFQPGAIGGHEGNKQQLGRPLLLGLDLLVAGDVVKTIALEPTLTNVTALGLLVLIRTALSWSITLEITGHWPWQVGTGIDDQRGNAGTSDGAAQEPNSGQGNQP